MIAFLICLAIFLGAWVVVDLFSICSYRDKIAELRKQLIEASARNVGFIDKIEKLVVKNTVLRHRLRKLFDAYKSVNED